MKLLRQIVSVSVFVLAGHTVQCQTFSVSFPDTITYGAAADSATLSCWINDNVTNLTENPIELDIVRVQNDTATPGWTSSFCFQFCSLPNVDSIRATLQPNEVVNIAVHFHITSTPDSGSVLMMFRNVNDTSEVFYQRFYAFSSPASTQNIPNSGVETVNIYPSPAISGQEFTLNINESVFTGSEFTLDVFDIQGRKVFSVAGLQAGENRLTLNVPSAVYTFTISDETSILFSGHLPITETCD